MAILQIEPTAWSTYVDSARPTEVIDGLHIAQNQSRIEKCLDFWLREKSFAAVMSDAWVASTRYGIDRKTGRVVWQTTPYFPRRLCRKIPDLWQHRFKENVLIPLQIDKVVLVATSFGSNGKNAGVYRFDVTSGRPLWIYQGASWFDRWKERNDKRKRQTVERQINPVEVQSGEIVGQSGVVLSTQTGRVVRREKRKPVKTKNERATPQETHERGNIRALLSDLKAPAADLTGRMEISGIGTVLPGAPNVASSEQGHEHERFAFPNQIQRATWNPRASLYPASPYHWFLRQEDGRVGWIWDTRYLSERLGDETIMETRRLKIHTPYLFYLHCVSTLEKEPEEEWEAIAAPFLVFVIAQDLRNGSIASIQQVSKEPILGPMLEAVDENGVLIRSVDRRLFYLPISSGR